MRRNIGQKFTAALVLFVMLAFASTSAFAAYSVKQTILRFQAVAAETLATGNVVMLKDSDGLAYKADANDAALRPAIGIIGKGGATGATVEIIVIGTLSGWTTLSEGGPGYLSETAGAITQSAPSYSQQVGQAINTTTYLVNFQNYFDSSSLTVLGTLSGATPLVFEGATANEFETSIAVADPTADRTVTIADADGTVMLSTLATNAPDVADSIWGISNGLAFGGATGGDGFELRVKPLDDPTADKIVKIPVKTDATVMISSLATNDVDVANSVWGVSNGLAFGGVTGGDGFELQLKPQGDPAADKILSMPVLNDAAVMISTLTTNNVDVANSVWGVSNGLAFGGSSGADGFETTLTVTDPTADRTVTIPNATGTVNLNCTATHDYGGAAVAWTLTAAEAQCGFVTATNANGAVDALLPAAIPGKTYTVNNGSGQVLTFKVTGQTGGTIANAKWGFYTTLAADVAEVYELP
ncbi:MAG: hypothetical protein NTY86_13210 [Deltaproteobacteria bacterium]|nr:hypothetical protein [Deltaproteobacteria bacterium]